MFRRCCATFAAPSAEQQKLVSKIKLLGDPALRHRPNKITHCGAPAVKAAARELYATLEAFRAVKGFGRAIAANQIGLDYRMIAIHINKPVILCNPTIYDASFEKHTLWDDCFSHPNLMVRVTRHKIISVKAEVLKNWQEEGNHQTDDPAADEVQLVDLSASESELLQHEIDHLDGLTSLDRLVPKEMHPKSPALHVESVIEREEYLNNKARYEAMVDFTGKDCPMSESAQKYL